MHSTSPNGTNLFLQFTMRHIVDSGCIGFETPLTETEKSAESYQTPSFSLGLGVWLLGNSNGCSIDTTASNDHEWCLHSLKDSSNVDLFKPLASVTWCSVIHRRYNTVVVYVLWCCTTSHVFMFWTIDWLQKAILAHDDTLINKKFMFPTQQ